MAEYDQYHQQQADPRRMHEFGASGGASLPPGAGGAPHPGYTSQAPPPSRVPGGANGYVPPLPPPPTASQPAADDFGAYNPHGGNSGVSTMPSSTSNGDHSTAGRFRGVSLRDPGVPLPPVPPRPREGGARKPLPKPPIAVQATPPPVPPRQWSPPPQSPSLSRRALPTPPVSSLASANNAAGSGPPPGYDHSRPARAPPVHDGMAHVNGPTDDYPSRTSSLASSHNLTSSSGTSHGTYDSMFTPSTVATSVTSHNSVHDKSANMQSIYGHVPVDIDGANGIHEDPIVPGTPKALAPIDQNGDNRSTSAFSFRTEAPQSPPQSVSPAPASGLAFPTPAPNSTSPTQATFPNRELASAMSQMSVAPSDRSGSTAHHGRHDYKDLYEELGVPESFDDQQPVASSSNMPMLSPNEQHGTQWAEESSRPWVHAKLLLHQSNGGGDEPYDDPVYGGYGAYEEYASSGDVDDVDDEMNEIRFFNPAFLSETAVQIRDRVIRGTHMKGGITWNSTFTGKDLLTTIQSFLPACTRDGPADRRFALQTARSLQSQLWVVEVDWEPDNLRDSEDVVLRFMSEMEGMGDVSLPKGVLTMATKCYSPSCTGDGKCYVPRCPYKTSANTWLSVVEDEILPGPSQSQGNELQVKSETDWTEEVDPATLASMSEQDCQRQTLIRQAILQEKQYEADLETIEQVFLVPLQTANPPIVQPYGKLDQYVRTLFANIVQIRRASRSLMDNFALRFREQGPLVQTLGDIFLEAATDFRSLYPVYTDNLPRADALLTQALEENRPFALWVDQASRGPEHRYDLRQLLKRPAMYLQSYPQLIEEIIKVTSPDSPDADFLQEALQSIQSISYITRLKLYQASKGRGPQGKLQWEEIVSPSVQAAMSKKEQKRQMVIWELIHGEMEYVADLEAIDSIFITPLREADQPVIDRSRLEVFLDDVFHNYGSILAVHERLLSDLHERQIEQHPQFGMISDLILNAALNWHEAYLEYMPNYPIAKAKVDEEKIRNPAFANFLAQCLKHPLANRQEINHYINRPIARLLRYPLLLKEILKAQEAVGPPDHPDIDTIPQILELIDNVAKSGQKGVAVNTAKVELWHLKTTLDGGKFGNRVVKDLDLLSQDRELIQKGKVYRQPEGTISGSWSELHLLLFDNYLVQVKQVKSKNKDAPLRYSINRKPIPLELLSLGDFFQPAQTRSLGLFKTIRGGGHGEEGKEQTQSDSKTVYPFTFSMIGAGLTSGQYTLWTDSEPARRDWHEKLKHAKVLRSEVNEACKVFEFTPLSLDTFYMAPGYGAHPHANQEYTGRVTCSVPFVTVDRRSLVAVGCDQGVWIGVRHDPSSLRKVLHVKNVTQITVLEEFGIFLVLADRSLLAYHLEALVPTAASPQFRSAPQRLSGMRDIVFFAVGQISGRTLVLYVKKKGIESLFKVLEPVLNRGTDDRRRGAFGGLLGQGRGTEWFRPYKEFSIPTETHRVHFLKAKLAIVCSRGFEILDLTDVKGGSIPIFDQNKARERPALAELARRCENATPVAMFRSTESEFLLCYDTFGIYVDRHGEPNRNLEPIEWEGKTEEVVFHPPYLLLVSPAFIEVRHIDTAKLLQIYTGVDMRCTWDGTGGMAKRHNDVPGPKGWGEDITSTEPRLHICQRTDDPRRTKGIGQHIFELTPTLLLNNPLLNPINTQDPNYFPPAPLNHRVSMGSGGYGGSGYNDPSLFPLDRQSVSSASTTTYGNGPNGPQTPSVYSNPTSNTLHPLGRRISDMSSSSGRGQSAFSTQFSSLGEHPEEYGGRVGSGQGYTNQIHPGMPPRESSNWSSQSPQQYGDVFPTPQSSGYAAPPDDAYAQPPQAYPQQQQQGYGQHLTPMQHDAGGYQHQYQQQSYDQPPAEYSQYDAPQYRQQSYQPNQYQQNQSNDATYPGGQYSSPGYQAGGAGAGGTYGQHPGSYFPPQ